MKAKVDVFSDRYQNKAIDLEAKEAFLEVRKNFNQQSALLEQHLKTSFQEQGMSEAQAARLAHTVTSAMVMVFADLKTSLQDQKSLSAELLELKLAIRNTWGLNFGGEQGVTGLHIDYGQNGQITLGLRDAEGAWRQHELHVKDANHTAENILSIIQNPHKVEMYDQSGRMHDVWKELELQLSPTVLNQIAHLSMDQVQVTTIKNQRFGWDLEPLNAKDLRITFSVLTGVGTDITTLAQAQGRNRQIAENRAVYTVLTPALAAQVMTAGQVDMTRLTDVLIKNENDAIAQARFREVSRVLDNVVRQQLFAAIVDPRLSTHRQELEGLLHEIAKVDRNTGIQKNLAKEDTSAIDMLQEKVSQVRQNLKRVMDKLSDIGAPDDLVRRISKMITASKDLKLTGNMNMMDFPEQMPALSLVAQDLVGVVNWFNQYINPSLHLPERVSGQNSDLKVGQKTFDTVSSQQVARSLRSDVETVNQARVNAGEVPLLPSEVLSGRQRFVEGRSLSLEDALRKNFQSTTKKMVKNMERSLSEKDALWLSKINLAAFWANVQSQALNDRQIQDAWQRELAQYQEEGVSDTAQQVLLAQVLQYAAQHNAGDLQWTDIQALANLVSLDDPVAERALKKYFVYNCRSSFIICFGFKSN